MYLLISSSKTPSLIGKSTSIQYIIKKCSICAPYQRWLHHEANEIKSTIGRMRQKNNIRQAWRGAGNFSYVWKNIRRHTSGVFSWNTPVIYWIPVHSSCTFHFLQVTVIANEIIPAILLVGNENYVVGVVDLRTYIYFKVAIRLFTSDTS